MLSDKLHIDDSEPQRLPGQEPFTKMIVRVSWWVMIISILVQFIFFWSIENAACVASVVIGWMIMSRIFLRDSMLQTFPFSSFLIIGYTATELYFPLVFTSTEGKPLIFNLELPQEVFLHSFLTLIVLALAHSIYRFLWRVSYTRSYSILERAGFFETPSDLQLWLMGAFGVLAQWYVFFTNPDIGRDVTTGTAFDKVIQALSPFSYAPLLIPLGRLFGNQKPLSKKIYPLLLAYIVVLLAVSIGRNSRGAFMLGLTAIAFAYVLGLLVGIYKTRLFTLRNGIIAGLLLWLLTGPIADLGTAMVVVRSEREKIPAMELIDLTLEAYEDKEAIYEYRREDQAGASNDWDEPYLDNIFAARFANKKFSDMTLIQYEKIGEFDPDMLDYSIDYFLAGLPEPFLEQLNVDVDKDAIYSVSFGDVIYLLGGGTGYPAGYRTGHYAGTGMAAFGWWYLLILGVLMIPCYFLFDKFYKRTKLKEGIQMNFSVCGLLAIYLVWGFLPNESVVAIATFLLRGWIQLALLYFLLFHITRIATKIFRGRRQRIRLRAQAT